MKHFSYFMSIFLLLSSTLHSQEKWLILAEGNTWAPMMPKNFIENHKKIKELPFSGFVMVGDSFTNQVMKPNQTVTHNDVYSELKGIQSLYPNKEIFMQINIDFPADFWDDKAWNSVTNNFVAVAKVAQEMGLKGIVFDDEPYSDHAKQMVNFKFPNHNEIAKTPKSYTEWEKKGAQDSWVDKVGYRNPSHNFKEHIEKVTERFSLITKEISKVHPTLTILVYNGPAYAHPYTNKENFILTDVGLSREHEYKGAIFSGFKKGLGEKMALHDMGESYKYRKNIHFENAYRWRKHDIAKDQYNDLNSSYHWTVPKEERASWSKEVNVGFMVFNKGQLSDYAEYDTRKKSRLINIKESLTKALTYSDKYVIYYCQDQDWLLPNQYPLKKGWMEMMREVTK